MRRRNAIVVSISICFIAAILVIGAVYWQKWSARQEIVSPTEYDVFSAYVAEKLKAEHEWGIVTSVVVLDATQSDESETFSDQRSNSLAWTEVTKELTQSVPQLQPETLRAFRKANLRQSRLSPAFHAGIDCRLVSSSEIDTLFKNDGEGWATFHKSFPGAWHIMKFSRVGFNSKGTQALFFVSVRCGGLCGSGSYIVMEKRDKGWVIVNNVLTWVS